MAETGMTGDRARSTGAFGPGSGVRQPIDRQTDTFRKALVARKARVAANRDRLIADRSRDLILDEIPPPQSQRLTRKPGEVTSQVSVGAGGP